MREVEGAAELVVRLTLLEVVLGLGTEAEEEGAELDLEVVGRAADEDTLDEDLEDEAVIGILLVVGALDELTVTVEAAIQMTCPI
jgi:hypothetical protein